VSAGAVGAAVLLLSGGSGRETAQDIGLWGS